MFGGWWAVLELTGIKHNQNSFYITDEVCVIRTKKKLFQTVFPEFWKYLLNIFSYLTVFKQGTFIM